ncbi:MAG: hypothetical protein GY834_06730, partial [Bacteroidetes bacterium]|nr:hypothetical protein [Bacteroidota bacterium]
MVSAIKVGKNALIKGLETGADAYLAKPIDEYVLAAQVKTALRIKKAEDLLRNQKKILENMVLERTDELMQTNSKLQHEIEEHRQTARKKDELQIQLVQSQKMESIGTLAGGIAHDFNNILFPIVGHTEMLLEDVSEDSSFRDSLNEIYTGALRASELVKQILTFSRQESGEMKLIKMQPIIREALKLIRSTIPTTIEIKQDIKTDCGVIKADPIQIHQIIMNLTTNAYHAMEETGGKLTVSLKEIEFAV